MSNQEQFIEAIKDLFPREGETGGGRLVTSGVAFDFISGIAADCELKTVAVVSAFKEDDTTLTPVVLDSKEGVNVFVLTQDEDHIVASREQLVSLRAAINLAIGE